MKNSKKRYASVVFGLFIILIGVALFGVRSGWVSNEVKNLIFSWPSILLLLAVLLLFKRNKNYFVIFILFAIGGFFMIEKVFIAFPNLAPDNINVSYFKLYLFPFILVLLGCYIIIRPFLPRKKYRLKHKVEFKINNEYKGGEFYEKNLAFGNSEHIFLESEFIGGEINVICGKAVLDLRNTTLPPDGSTLVINVIMGEAILYVPESWQIQTDLDIIMAEFKNIHKLNNELVESPKLIIKGSIVMGATTLI